VAGEQRLTYPQFQEQARQLAKGLLRLGVRRGDKVAILMGNRAEWLLVDFAVASIGATLVALSTWGTARELEYVLRHADVTTLITVDRFLRSDYVAMLAEICPELPRACPGELCSARLPYLRRVVCLGGQDYPGTYRFQDLWELGGTAADADLEAVRAQVQPADIAYILYTSGSTATPKGVQLQHFALIENMWGIGERLHLTEADRLWLAVSLFWGLGCENALFALMTHGGCLVLQEHFEAGQALRLIERERCTVYYGLVNMTAALFEHPDRPRRDLTSLRTGVTIGPPRAIQLAMDLGIREICNVYGLTETYGNCTVTDAHDPVDVRLHTVGRPLPGMRIKIADTATRQPLPPGEVGEICVRGYVTPGYHKDPEKNAAAFDAEGFLLTGDLGCLDRDGRLRFRGRLKEIVKSGGLNVSPLEVEEVLLTHPEVEQAHVVGVPDRLKDEVLAAVVVPREGAVVSAEELRAFCRERLAAFKVPQHFRFWKRGDFPLTATGKVQKVKLREELMNDLASHQENHTHAARAGINPAPTPQDNTPM
jgi:fatty-acyl-CoA synthase